MRLTGYLGAALVLAGCLLVLASTGAFDATLAERGMAVDTASDQNAFLGLEYGGPGQTIILESADCTPYPPDEDFQFLCLHPDEELAIFENNTDGKLNISQISIQDSGDVGTYNEGVRYEPGSPGIGRVLGNFYCIRGPFSGNQQSASSDVTIDLVATGDNLTVDLTRTITVECEAGPT